ncbi:MAG: hypothetical protein J6S75_09020, partial [Thermoguttaceae bacterium]|nr:hypothetical protein [Thermoguttaceae bacterium]
LVSIEGDYVERIFAVCRGLGAICFGSGIYPTAAATDGSGLRVMSAFARGGHAQAFFGYQKIGREEYIWNQNSHGDRYGSTPNEPASGAWVTRRELEMYCRDMDAYGCPLAIFAEGEPIGDVLANTFTLPRA